jgi:hypothetical protein
MENGRREVADVQLCEEGGVFVQVIHNLHVVEINYRVDGREGHVVEEPGQNDVLEVLDPEGLVNLLEDVGVPDGDDFLEDNAVLKVLAMLQLGRHLGIVCRKRERERDADQSELLAHHSGDSNESGRAVASAYIPKPQPWSCSSDR